MNSYGGGSTWEKIKKGLIPPHHLWGCIELVRLGYEVAIAEPLRHFYLYRKPLPHDLSLLRFAKQWLGKDGIIYCGHTLLYWLPFLKMLGALKSPIVSLTYGREELDFARQHNGIIALTPASAEQARKMAPRAKVAHLGWGVDLDFYPALPYEPNHFLSCGITHRDHGTLSRAAEISGAPLRVICPRRPEGVSWSANVSLVEAGQGINTDEKEVTYRDLIHEHYRRAIASLIIINDDPTQYTANGFTNLIEAMALARPVIFTRTGAVPSEIDVEAAGCGIHVPSGDAEALAAAIRSLQEDPQRAEELGRNGRRLAETHYNTGRFSEGLHQFFSSL